MDDSDSSSLSDVPEAEVQKLAPIFLKSKVKTKAKNAGAPLVRVSPPRPKRPPSPIREETLADNSDIAFLVMFRSRFSAAFPPKMSHFGPQDIERGVVGSEPSPQVENLLCALLAILLNRKKPVERGHHGRALEEAMLSQKAQWPHSWNGVNPLHGNRNFNTMTPQERLNLLKTLAIWSLSSSEIVSASIKDSYKQSRHDDDMNQPLSVQSWGKDGDKRTYWLVEGQDDTSFRVYRESERYKKTNYHWRSVAGTIDEVKALATKLETDDTTQNARRLAQRITNAVPRFEATEEKVRRREYRQIRRAAFTRHEPGFSLYEGRTRGKRMRYTFEEDEDFGEDSDATSTRRSNRFSGRSTPAEIGPTFTASGRQIRARGGGMYGESLLSGQVMSTDELAPNYSDQERDGSEGSEPIRGGGRATRSAGRSAVNGNHKKRKNIDGYNDVDAMSDEDDATPSADEWDGGDDADDIVISELSDDDMSEEDEKNDEEDHLGRSLIVKLKLPISNPKAHGTTTTAQPVANGHSKHEEHHVALPTNGLQPHLVAHAGVKRPATSPVSEDAQDRRMKPKSELHHEIQPPSGSTLEQQRVVAPVPATHDSDLFAAPVPDQSMDVKRESATLPAVSLAPQMHGGNDGTPLEPKQAVVLQNVQ